MTPRPKEQSTTQFELEHFLPYRFSVITNTVSEGLADSYRKKHNLSVTEWRVLAVLGRFPGLTASEVTNRTAMDKVSISRAVTQMMERDLLYRETDPTDRRRRQLFLTDSKGKTVLQDVVPKATTYEKALLNILTPEEQSQLSSMLSRLHGQALLLNDEQKRKNEQN